MLTDIACRKAKAGEKDRKLADSKGLFLLVRPNGSKLWRLKYRHLGKEKQLALGAYPDVTLEQARLRRADARALLEQGIDPSVDRKQRRATAAAQALNTFERSARAWHAQLAETRNSRYSGQVLDRLEQDVFPQLGILALQDITPPMVLGVLQRIEARGAREMARRVRMHISHVFDWAIGAGIAETNPAERVGRALLPAKKALRPAVVTIAQARSVLTKAEALPDIHWATLLASRLLALTAARPGNVRLAERAEFKGLDGPDPVWHIPAAKLKLKAEHQKDPKYDFVIPLSRQAVATVKAAIAASKSPRWLFPGIAGWKQPISDSTLSAHYRDAGFTGVHVPHGWRATFSTIMNERAAIAGRMDDRAIIDMMLAHMQGGVEPIYNRAAYMPRRRELAQEWSDLLLDGMPGPDTLTPSRP